MRRRTGWVALVAFVPVLVLVAVQVFFWKSLRGSWAPFFQFFYWMPMYLSIAYHQRTARQFHARLADHDYRLCCWCGYDLRRIADAGRCPECGEWYDVRTTRHEWTTEGPRL